MKTYHKTDQQLHLFCQIIAKANRTFVPKKADDSHTNLFFDPLGNRITGRWIDHGNSRFILSLNLKNLQFEVLDAFYELVFSVHTVGWALEETENEIERMLPEAGLDPEGFKAPLHFEIPIYPFAHEPITSIEQQGLDQWKYYRKLANQACYSLLGHAQVEGETRIWPHHFDTGIYSQIHENIGVGFGLAMQDRMVGAPYFYMSGYSKEGFLSYENLPKGKGWGWELGEHWNGAILPLTTLENEPEDQQKRIIEEYLRSAFHWFVKPR